MRKFTEEFKKFALKGNVMDLAVGVIIGGAFGTITASLVNDVIMPVVSMFLGGINFADWKITLPRFFASAADAEPNTLNYGTFISTIINFFILALVVFLIVKTINKIRERAEKREAKPEKPAPAPQPTKEELLLTEIRDLLKDQKNVD